MQDFKSSIFSFTLDMSRVLGVTQDTSLKSFFEFCFCVMQDTGVMCVTQDVTGVLNLCKI